MNSSSQLVQKQIEDIESRIANFKHEIQYLNEVLAKLKMQQFEEDLRNTDNKQLLKG